jgi:two-component system chemotaxis sensor kinase CheA
MDKEAFEQLKAQAFAIYQVEVQESLDSAEEGLLQLEESPHDQELINAVFRDLHTIKGSSGMNGVDNVAAFVHKLEDAYDRARDGLLAVNAELIDVALQSLDYVRQLIAVQDDINQTDTALAQRLQQRIATLMGAEGAEPDPQDAGEAPAELGQSEPVAAESEEAEYTLYHVAFAPDEELMFRGTNLIGLLEELEELGICRVLADNSVVPDLDQLDPQHIHLSWRLLLATTEPLGEIEDVFMFVEEDSTISVDPLLEALTITEAERLVEQLFLLLDADLAIPAQSLAAAAVALLEDQRTPLEEVQPEQIEQQVDAVADSGVVKSAEKKGNGNGSSPEKQFIRVPSDRLDRQLDLVGELVIAQSSLSQFSGTLEDGRLNAIAEIIERLTSDLRDNAMNLRMLPVGNLFSRYKRVVRDISSNLGKKIRLDTIGDETELDKTVIDQLGDPLVHLIRNSADHGIESPQQRMDAGKPEEGTITLEASHEGGNVVVTIRDDGKGLDREVILAKAIDRGLLDPDLEYSDSKIFSQILEPGFSTAQQVSDMSGRGVGVDVVKRTIESLRGTIEMESKKGVGTEIHLRLPLTLAIIDGLLIDAGGDFFVIPLGLVEEVVELQQARGKNRTGRNILNIRDSIVPFVYLRELFEIPGTTDEIERVVIVSNGGARIGLVVDRVVGQHQTVIKGLSKMYENVGNLSGSTILGDGSVALILDVPALVRFAELRLPLQIEVSAGNGEGEV